MSKSISVPVSANALFACTLMVIMTIFKFNARLEIVGIILFGIIALVNLWKMFQNIINQKILEAIAFAGNLFLVSGLIGATLFSGSSAQAVTNDSLLMLAILSPILVGFLISLGMLAYAAWQMRKER